MANRRWNVNEQLKVTDDVPRPSPGISGQAVAKVSEKAPPYPGASGPKRRGSYSTKGFNKVKTRVQEDL